MTARIQARLGDVVDITIPLRYRKAEVDRLPDREHWTHYLLFSDLGNPNGDVALAANSHDDGFPLASDGFPAGVPLNPSDQFLSSYRPAPVRNDDQEVTASLWLNPDLRSGGARVFKAGRTVEVVLVYVGGDLANETGRAKSRSHPVARIEVLALEGAAGGTEEGDGGAPWARGGPA